MHYEVVDINYITEEFIDSLDPLYTRTENLNLYAIKSALKKYNLYGISIDNFCASIIKVGNSENLHLTALKELQYLLSSFGSAQYIITPKIKVIQFQKYPITFKDDYPHELICLYTNKRNLEVTYKNGKLVHVYVKEHINGTYIVSKNLSMYFYYSDDFDYCVLETITLISHEGLIYFYKDGVLRKYITKSKIKTWDKFGNNLKIEYREDDKFPIYECICDYNNSDNIIYEKYYINSTKYEIMYEYNSDNMIKAIKKIASPFSGNFHELIHEYEYEYEYTYRNDRICTIVKKDIGSYICSSDIIFWLVDENTEAVEYEIK